MPAPLIDTHCHLDFDRFTADRTAVIARARAAGLVRLITVGAGSGLEGSRSALTLAHRGPEFLSATVGLHPHEARLGGLEYWKALAEMAADPAVVAVGETGLDFHYNLSPAEDQRAAFRRQIGLARDLKKPLVIHTREAAAETLETLRRERANEVGGVIHCFSEDAAFAAAALDLGFAASFSGLVTFDKADPIREAARLQPAAAILVETDAPYLAPAPHRGRRNEPAFVAATAAFIARLRGEDEDEFRRQTTRNAERVFGLKGGGEGPEGR